MNSSSWTGVVHTKAEYAPELDMLGGGMFRERSQLQGRWQTLRDQENAIYQQLFSQAKDIWSFLAKLREIFANNLQDYQVIRFFEAGRIREQLSEFIQRRETGVYHEITFKIKSQKSIPIDLQRELATAGITVRSDKGTTSIELGMDTSKIKASLNTLLGRHFKTESKNLQTLRKVLNEEEYITSQLIQLLEADSVTIERTNSEDTLTTQVIANSPFKYTADDLRDAQALGMQSDLYQEIVRARQEIYTMIWTRSGLGGASPKMQEAFRRVWDANIQKNFEGLALFEKGGSYTALVGAFGEFQAALLFEYVNQVAANSLMIPLISNSLKSGEQAKADVTILQQVGIQVKNYNPMSSRGLLETNIHPSKIQQYGAAMNMEMFDSDFMDFLANYFFNRTYQEENSGNMQLLEDALGMFFGDLANLAVADSINDTVSFYVIEGQYFVPGSYILEAIEKNDTVQKEVTITGPSVPYGDEDYESVEIRSKKRREGYFSRWWTPSNGSYTPTQYNYSTYEGLINSKISIRSGFNYNKLNIPRFSIY